MSGGVWSMSGGVWWCLVVFDGVWSMSNRVNVYRLIGPELMYMGRYVTDALLLLMR